MKTTIYDIDGSVRKPATNLEFDKLRDELFNEHDLFVALRGRKFVPIEAGTIFELSKHTDEQIREIVEAYGDMIHDVDFFIDTLKDYRNEGFFGIILMSVGAYRRLYFVEDRAYAVKIIKNNSKHNTLSIKHHNDVCKED